MVIFVHENISYTIIIGKNAKDNTNIVKNASPTDIWFHVSGKSSCHIILVNTEKLNSIPRQVIKRCAYLCKAKTRLPTCQIIYTTVDNVHCTHVMGQVTTTGVCKTIAI
jgi:predicted ribosome quality control (RQC) complex YloA/Tae2 family protein